MCLLSLLTVVGCGLLFCCLYVCYVVLSYVLVGSYLLFICLLLCVCNAVSLFGLFGFAWLCFGCTAGDVCWLCICCLGLMNFCLWFVCRCRGFGCWLVDCWLIGLFTRDGFYWCWKWMFAFVEFRLLCFAWFLILILIVRYFVRGWLLLCLWFGWLLVGWLVVGVCRLMGCLVVGLVVIVLIV